MVVSVQDEPCGDQSHHQQNQRDDDGDDLDLELPQSGWSGRSSSILRPTFAALTSCTCWGAKLGGMIWAIGGS